MIRRRAPDAAELATSLSLPLLEPFTAPELGALIGPAPLAIYEDDTKLFAAGDPADRFFAVIEGSVRLYVTLPDGRETIIAVLGAPASFGEAAMFSSGLFPVNAIATAGSALLHIDAAAFLANLAARPALGLSMLQSMRKWELRLLEEIRQAKLLSTAQRLAGFLLSLCDGREGEVTVKLPFRKTLLADKLGIKPETLSRNLQRLAAAGVFGSGDTLTIPNTAILQRLFQGR